MKSYAFPGNIKSDILSIGNQQIPYMRTQEFSSLVLELEQMLLSLFHSPQGKIIFYTSSGTGAMDSIVCNYVSTKKKAIIINGGSFGHRWEQLCEYYKCNYVTHKVPFAKDIDYTKLEDDIRKEHPEVLLCQHHETSSGQKFNLEHLSTLCKKYNISLVVDAISSFLADSLDIEKLDIDICITSSQKGLNIPPGISFVVLSPNLFKYPFAHNSYYFDFQENLKNLQRGQTPYSPATTLFIQAHKRCVQIIQNGGAIAQIKATEEKAKIFRECCKKYNWIIPAENPSNAITGFYINHNESILFRTLIEQYNIFIMPGSINNFFRVSHMGEQNEADLIELSEAIKAIERL